MVPDRAILCWLPDQTSSPTVRSRLGSYEQYFRNTGTDKSCGGTCRYARMRTVWCSAGLTSNFSAKRHCTGPLRGTHRCLGTDESVLCVQVRRDCCEADDGKLLAWRHGSHVTPDVCGVLQVPSWCCGHVEWMEIVGVNNLEFVSDAARSLLVRH